MYVLCRFCYRRRRASRRSTFSTKARVSMGARERRVKQTHRNGKTRAVVHQRWRFSHRRSLNPTTRTAPVFPRCTSCRRQTFLRSGRRVFRRARAAGTMTYAWRWERSHVRRSSRTRLGNGLGMPSALTQRRWRDSGPRGKLRSLDCCVRASGSKVQTGRKGQGHEWRRPSVRWGQSRRTSLRLRWASCGSKSCRLVRGRWWGAAR